jgi:hypothetical protein
MENPKDANLPAFQSSRSAAKLNPALNTHDKVVPETLTGLLYKLVSTELVTPLHLKKTENFTLTHAYG